SPGPCPVARCPWRRLRRGRGPTDGGGSGSWRPSRRWRDGRGRCRRAGRRPREPPNRSRGSGIRGSQLELLELDAASFEGGTVAGLGELDAAGGGEEVVVPGCVVDDVAQEFLPLEFETVVELLVVGHFVPLLAEGDRL